MSDERKPTEDLREGLSLIMRAAKTAAKRVDVGKIDRTLDKAFTQVGRVVTTVGRVVGDEINRVSASPPWAKDEPATTDAASEAPKADASVDPSAAPPEPPADAKPKP